MMRRALIITICFLVAMTTTKAQNYDFKIMSWNIEWFGEPSYCNCDTALQRTNVETVLQIEKPDIVALQEIVDVDKMHKVADAHGYNFYISQYGSLAADENSGNYPSAQKLAFLYKKSNIIPIEQYGLTRSTYPLYSNNNSPYYYFASGRFPLLHSFEIYDGTDRDTITLVNIHAKASSGNTNYYRRKNGAIVMQDSLDKNYINDKVLILGDFNDLLEGSTTSSQYYSPYEYNITRGYIPLTKPSDFPGERTYVFGSGDIIDNFIASPKFASNIENNSVEILSRVTNYITSYGSTTSDHYPIMLKYVSHVPNILGKVELLRSDRVYIGVNNNILHIEHHIRGIPKYRIFNLQGKLILENNLEANEMEIDISDFSVQAYLITIEESSQLIYRKVFVKL